MRKILFLVIYFLFIEFLFSQSAYMPLKTGNSCTYSVGYGMSYCCRMKITVLSDTVFNGNKYYRTSARFPIAHVWDLGLIYYRVDSASGNFFGYLNPNGCSYYPNEILIDSLSANINNISSICPLSNQRVCTDIKYFSTPWGQSYLRKRFQHHNANTQTPSAYFYNMGLAGSADGPLGETSYDIIGCTINGITYGDTALVGIEIISNVIPDKFSLSQNYPNPFNPTTKIKFDLPSMVNGELSIVNLKIFDVLGKEVQTLVNEKLSPGSYEVEFDARNFSSGIYFYKIKADGFNKTKRMLLIK